MKATQLSLLSQERMVLDEEGCRITYHSRYLSTAFADAMLEELLAETAWKQDIIRIYGKEHPLPRLHRWFAPDGRPYRWSGIVMEPEPFPGPLERLRQQLIVDYKTAFSTALANLYRDENDSVSWHSDDEPELEPKATIASVSLGATRRFLLRRRSHHAKRIEVDLEHGSLLLMDGATQQLWEHSIPKTRRPKAKRVNITFRATTGDAQ